MKTVEKNNMSLAGTDGSQKMSKKRLRIAILNRTFSATGGGAERYSIALVEQLAARHEIHVFAQEIDHQWPGVHYHPVSSPLLKPRWVNQLWYAACTWQATRGAFDIVHSHENIWHGNVHTVHVLPVKYNLFKRVGKWRALSNWIRVATSPRLQVYLGLECLRFAFRTDKRVVVTSESLRSAVETAYPACSEMISVITPSITMPPSPVTHLSKQSARALLGLPLIGHCILFVANDFRKKGLGTLLTALSHCPVDFVLAVVGNRLQQDVFAKQAERLGVANRVFFIGTLKVMVPAYEAADCLVHPTLEDTFAMVVLEAMSYGLPVIVSSDKYCGVSSLLQHGVNAWVTIDPTDASELHMALEAVLGEAVCARDMGKLAQAFASAYHWSNSAQAQELVYFSAVAKKLSGNDS